MKNAQRRVREYASDTDRDFTTLRAAARREAESVLVALEALGGES